MCFATIAARGIIISNEVAIDENSGMLEVGFEVIVGDSVGYGEVEEIDVEDGSSVIFIVK